MAISTSAGGGRWSAAAPIAGMVAGVLAWLWPVGLCGKMPVGGDVTQFSIGLLAFLRNSTRAGRLPLWNDLWGFGFPALAESQMGVYYPPHLLLYAALPTEVAFALSLVLHTLWAALGARWAARQFGASELGAAVGGFAFATCGMFLIHQSHHWAYTAGSWMPWAWGLAWRLARGEGSRRTGWILAGVLAVQILPGHFQLAFITEVGALLLALTSGRRAIRAAAAVGLALAGALPLAAMQLGPTLELAVAAGGDRTLAYLSGYATTPMHLISYVAPGLFHRSPLWRPLAWDLFATSPEENLAYVGLVPLWLALAAVVRGWKVDPGVRALAVVALATTVLSLGPYAPGFRLLIQLPGFSFFRAPARWGLASGLALSILAGLGLDRLRGWDGAGRWLARSALAALLITAGAVAAIEVGLATARGTNRPGASALDRSIRDLAFWDTRLFRAVAARAFRPQDDQVVRTTTARLEGKPAPAPGVSFAAARGAIYRRELIGPAALLVLLIGLSRWGRRPGVFLPALIAVAGVDPILVARHRHFDFGPVRSLVAQSPTLAEVATWPRGVRTLDPGQNLFLVAGAGSASAYRTLDLPSPFAALLLARNPAEADPRVARALRVAGIGALVIGPLDGPLPPAYLPAGWRATARFDDPALATWLIGEDYARAERETGFAIARPDVPAARAWLVAALPPGADRAMIDPDALLGALGDARPLVAISDRPERDRIEVEAGAVPAGKAPPLVVLSKTFDPEWQAVWVGPEGDRPATVERVLGGWQGVRVPGPGRWTLRLEYRGRAALIGLAVSAAAWSIWVWGWARLGGRRAGARRAGGGEAS